MFQRLYHAQRVFIAEVRSARAPFRVLQSLEKARLRPPQAIARCLVKMGDGLVARQTQAPCEQRPKMVICDVCGCGTGVAAMIKIPECFDKLKGRLARIQYMRTHRARSAGKSQQYSEGYQAKLQEGPGYRRFRDIRRKRAAPAVIIFIPQKANVRGIADRL